MTKVLRRLWEDASAQDLAEYGIALAVIGSAAALAALAVAFDIDSIWQVHQANIDMVASAVGP